MGLWHSIVQIKTSNRIVTKNAALTKVSHQYKVKKNWSKASYEASIHDSFSKPWYICETFNHKINQNFPWQFFPNFTAQNDLIPPLSFHSLGYQYEALAFQVLLEIPGKIPVAGLWMVIIVSDLPVTTSSFYIIYLI